VRAALPLVAALAVAVIAGCGGASHPPARRPAPAPARASCVDRLPLDTLLRVPDGPRRPRPLILALHGARQSGYGLQSYTGFTDDAPEFLVAYPNTPHDNGFWRVDDVPRLLALVDAIGRCVPVTGVTAVGFSNGGLMANALACRAARRVRAVVLVASGYEGLGRCAPAAPVSVLSIHGSRDQVVAYRGMRAFVDKWARRDRCASRPTARGDAEGVTHLRWHGCAAGTRVEHLRVADDTHGWPALVDANQRMVRFLHAVG
jgi:polyhydroxybutyrate depolymerase